MPHIKLEHTKKINNKEIQFLFEKLIKIIIKHADVKENNCKCKAIHIPIYSIGNKNQGGFFHIEISLLIGRSEKIKKNIGKDTLEILKSIFNLYNSNNDIQYSMEIKELKPNHYFTTNNI